MNRADEVLPANHPAAARMRAASPIAIAKIAQANPRANQPAVIPTHKTPAALRLPGFAAPRLPGGDPTGADTHKGGGAGAGIGLLKQLQHALLALVRLGKHRGRRLAQDLRLGERLRLGREVGVLDAALGVR